MAGCHRWLATPVALWLLSRKALVSAQRQTTWSLHLGKEARLEREMLVGVGGRLV